MGSGHRPRRRIVHLRGADGPDGYGVNPDYALLARPGDVVDYDDVGRVGYGGAFGQIEYAHNKFSFTLSLIGFLSVNALRSFRCW